jgi:hypothetical protein
MKPCPSRVRIFHVPSRIGTHLGLESGNMLIMTLSYTQKSGDKSLIQSYVRIPIVLSCYSTLILLLQPGLLDQWTQFLIQDSLIPQNQISTDDFAGSLANQTNLGRKHHRTGQVTHSDSFTAIKGIIGIQAMSAIESLLGNTDKSNNYSVRALLHALRLHTDLIKGNHLYLRYSVLTACAVVDGVSSHSERKPLTCKHIQSLMLCSPVWGFKLMGSHVQFVGREAARVQHLSSVIIRYAGSLVQAAFGSLWGASGY